MPPVKCVESLEHQCFSVLATLLHKICTNLEAENNDSKENLASLSAAVSTLPVIINEKMIVKVIETVHQIVNRTRRAIGLGTCLKVLLQSHLQNLDLNGLFFRGRLPSHVNTTIRNIVSEKVKNMKNLVVLNMVSNCSDEILKNVGGHCRYLKELIITLSDLVTDNGIKFIAQSCKQLEKLGIYKCWEVTSEAVLYVLLYSPNISELHSDQLGQVLLSSFKNTVKKFKLIHFEQTNVLFEPAESDLLWVGQACNSIKSIRLSVDDEFLYHIPLIGNIKTLDIDSTKSLGEGFLTATQKLGHSLVILQLSCNDIDQEIFLTLGETCPHLAILHVITPRIICNESFRNPGNLFCSLKTLHLQIWKHPTINKDHYLRNSLTIPHLERIVKLELLSDNPVPLTAISAYYLVDHANFLENLAISSWDVSEDEFMDLVDFIKKSNLNIRIY